MRTIFKISIVQCVAIIFSGLFVALSYAGSPLWTFTPDTNYPPNISITPIGSAYIQYVVTNQSKKTHTLAMKPMAGITQVTSPGSCPSPFTLGYQQFCTLTLFVSGSALPGSVVGGPIVCDQNNVLQCYQPDQHSILNVTRTSFPEYVITPTSAANGTITPNLPQVVNSGSTLVFNATPNTHYFVDEWLVDGGVVQRGGETYTLSDIQANHVVEVTFTKQGTIYAGTLDGNVYFSTNNGSTWFNTIAPSPGNPLNSVFATKSTLYAGSADSKVYYSTNNGGAWNATNPVSDNSAVNSLFVISSQNVVTIYAGTQNGHVYVTTDGTNWSALTSPGAGAVNGIFVTPNNTIYIGCGDGNVYYSTNNGTQWNIINGPEANTPIQNIFVANDQLYVNTRKTSSNTTLPPGTINFEYAYSTHTLTDPNPIWSLFSQITYTFFVNADASTIHAGTQDGYVFSLTTGNELGFVAYSPINSLYFLE